MDMGSTKKILLREYWTEDFHKGLEELEDNQAIKIVESMSEAEINKMVNRRTFQEDYISDYLTYLWDISRDSFWKHVEIIFKDIKSGPLWSDNLFYFEKLCYENFPSNVLVAIIKYIACCNSATDFDFDLVGDVIRSQIENFNRQSEIENIISSLPTKIQSETRIRISKMAKEAYSYR